MSALAASALPRTAQRTLIIAALGVVYGDIGTSPLYALRQSLIAYGETTPEAVLAAVSMIAWSLILVVTVKYVLVIMRADNRGEGGLLALTALALRALPQGRLCTFVMSAGLIGAALFYGDAIITPAISVLSAVEGLKVATPLFEPYVIPISILLLAGLFAVQRRGTGSVGMLFGPLMLLWFATLAVLGIAGIVREPQIISALNPVHALKLFLHAPWLSFLMLGAVFLAVTGAETLYADMGHFGRGPMRTAWLYIVFPGLTLNYFGQGALLLGNPAALESPFYLLVPSWGLYPLVALASAATIIASQAVISGAFSITRQAVQLGYLPRVRVLHTSEEEIGQVYVPRVNWWLFIAVILLILGFQTSDDLGAAYGIAVTGMMTITTMLAYVYARAAWKWSLPLAALVFGGFLTIDVAFLSANLLKVTHGGWFPMLVAAAIFTLMSTWWRGRRLLADIRAHATIPLQTFVEGIKPDRPARVPGTALVMARDPGWLPQALLHALKHFKVLHEHTALLTIETQDVPHVSAQERMDVQVLGKGIYSVRMRYGFMDTPNVTAALADSPYPNLRFDPMETSVVIGREKLLPHTQKSKMSKWRRRLFIFMSNNAYDATEYFRIPPNRVVELGGQVEI
jgi:KUP system potassium uptake protein